MNDRKLRKILKENAINSRVASRQTSSRRYLRRLTQVAACLLVVCLLGAGYVVMVRFVGLPGDPQDTSPEAGGVHNSGTVDTASPVNGEADGTLPPIDTASEDLTGYDKVTDRVTSSHIGIETADPAITTEPDTSVPVEIVLPSTMPLNIYAVDTSDRLEWGGDDITGDTLGDAVVERRYKLAEAVGCDNIGIQYFATPTLLNEAVIRDVAAGMMEYGLVTASAESIMNLTTNGALNDLAQMSGIDLVGDREYWNGCMAEALTVGRALYFVSGRLSMGTMLSANVLSVDTAQLKTACGVETKELYSLVLEGKWTLDRMLTLASEARGVGLAFDGDDGMHRLVNGAGLKLVTNALDISEVWSDGSLETLVCAVNGMGDRLSAKVTDGALFSVTTLSGCDRLSFSHGLLPLPAATEEQAAQGYRAPVGQGAVYYAIPHQYAADDMAAVLDLMVTELTFDDSCIVRRYASGDAAQTVLASALAGLDVNLDSVISQAEQSMLRGLAGAGSSSSAMLKNLAKINDKMLMYYEQIVN